MGKTTRGVPIIMAETVSIGEAVRMSTQLRLENIIEESDSQIAVNSITDKTKAPNQDFQSNNGHYRSCKRS